MIKYPVLLLIFTLRLFIHPGTGQVAAFTEPQAAKLLSFKGKVQEQKILLQWSVDENETADQFEVQKSTDGKHFQMAALAFGSEKKGICQYEFYEKVGNQKVLYRIKLINKDQKMIYSQVVTIDPLVKKS